ncbi:DUF1311 domain-containing protein [Nitrogeniibacter mangrovi]|uniref:DUF1311 domain-containing protein n=1 Tax=Nitrogeniibacter mangrovi TaxID=2016596 RepID=A0A6C1B614_9RHOO|nr:MliC family protein [Nitrogeniibacter mangrovi]QID17684.1 DUF1311 domain-containing protein [Nitrogeniibacter mangrovi]
MKGSVCGGRLGFAGLMALGAIVAQVPARAAGPAFDCTKVDRDAPRRVCADPDLAALDRELNRVYRLALRGSSLSSERRQTLKVMQRGWIKGRDDCWKAADLTACVREAYVLRIHELREGYVGARAQDEAGISLGPWRLDCGGLDAAISVSFVNSVTPHAVMRWGDRVLFLDQARSASGARYVGSLAGAPAALWIKGAAARFTLSGRAPHRCRFNAPDRVSSGGHGP